MLRLTLAQVRAHVGRLVASCLGIIIAVGFVVATLVLTDTSKATVLKAVGARYVDAAAVVTTATSAQPVDPAQPAPDPSSTAQTPDVAEVLAGVTGVAGVSAETQTFVEVDVAGRGGSQYASVESVATAAELQWQVLAGGRLPAASGEVAVSARVGAELGDTLRVTVYGMEAQQPGTTAEPEPVVEDVIVVGVVDLGADPTAGVQGRLFATSDQVAAWGGTDPYEYRIAAVAGTDPDNLVAQLESALREQGLSATVRTGEQAAEAQAAQFTGEAAALSTVLLVFASLAMLIAGMVIANTFSVLLAQRTRELALLRCVGASASQVRRGVLTEAAITGFGASMLGVGGGIGLAALTTTIAGQSQSAIPLEGLSVPPFAVLLGLALGTVITVLAAVFPAMSATRVAPLAALRPSDLAPIRSKRGLGNLALGLLLFGSGVAVLLFGVQVGDVPAAVGGGALSALGILLLLQRIIPPVVALAGRAAAPFGGVPASLAAGNATRNPRRTAATATALLIGVSLTTAMIVGASSTKATAEAELRSSYPTDVIVTSHGEEIPEGLLDELTGVDGVATGASLTSTEVTGPDGFAERAFGVDPVAGGQTARSGDAGVPDVGEVFLAAWLAESWGISHGAPVTLTKGGRSVMLTAQLSETSTAITMTAADLAVLDAAAPVGQIWLRLVDDRGAEADAITLDEITSIAGQGISGVEVAGVTSVRQALTSILDTLLLIVTALLGVAVLIALIGVGNTLALSVIERRQENGLMRALGLTRGQLRGLLAWEALLVAGVAAVLGVVIGSAYGLAGTSAILGQAGELVLDIPWLQVGAVVGVATVAGVLASVLPARRAARTSPVAAMST